MSSSEPDYVSRATGKQYRLEPAARHCVGCAFTIYDDETATRAGRALTAARLADCMASRGCHNRAGAGSVFKEIV